MPIAGAALDRPWRRLTWSLPAALILTGLALARFHVAADGSATVTLLQATPDPGLNAGLMAALQKWRFFPAMDNGRPVASTIDIRVPIEVR